ncbi:glycosyltransferase family 4 protein [Robbsia sp. Bb-Pol-6]|uniref:Glycosyltransferase family 4 protein n=1 Tax=Robbsia betulipollinis TaxID=2981849 RepID=A0ABT3ZTB3_9BURK|nr:glycosyltransferase family 4 protein [Robbsia betulipollinis]MCY0389806.1 glycosyltransferase family 4 protein [Robbsia betulipollinis]
MLHQADETGEAERGMFDLCTHANFDWSAALFAKASCKARFESPGKSVEIVASHGFDTLRDGAVFRGVLNFAPKARGVVQHLTKAAQAADVVLMSGHSALAMAAGGLAGALAGRPVVWYVQDIIDEKQVSKWELQVLRVVSKWMVSGVICHSHAAKKSFVSLVGARSSHIEVIHPGVTTAAFDSAMSCSKAHARSMFGLPEEAYLIGCFDRLSPRKGQHVVLEALARDADTHVLMTGETVPGAEQYAAELKLKIRELGLTHRVHFVGRQADVPVLMRAVDVVVNASTQPEAFDWNVVSGMLASLPVIASRVGANPEIIQHMKSGILVKPEDPESLLRSMQMLRNNPEFAERLGKDAALRGRARFLPESCVQSVTAFLRRYAVAGRTHRAWPVGRSATSATDATERGLAVNINTMK